MSPLRLTSAALASLRQACEAAFPLEACGLLLGPVTPDVAAPRHVTAIVTGRNLERAADRFALDPADFLRADALAGELGLDIVGSFHSHPGRRAIPSRADAEAALAGWSHVIVEVGAGRSVDVRSWRLEPGVPGLGEEPLVIDDSLDEPCPARRSA